jgi:pimeloyl-ACP methyl ester carboxylesterase
MRFMPLAAPRPEPFAPRASPAELSDLRGRLHATRWPDAPEDAGWSLGTDLSALRELVDYWADGYSDRPAGTPLDSIAVAGLCTGRTARSPGTNTRGGLRCPPASRCSRGICCTPPRAWLERTANVVRVTEAPRGGHFAAFEEPEFYAAELREFFRPYRAAVAG